jgi:hypothetical protein
MTDIAIKPKLNVNPAVVLFRYFRSNSQTVREFAVELNALTDDDKRQLSEGIQNGTLTY